MKKKFILLMAVALCLIFAGCQKEEAAVVRTFLAGYEVGAGEDAAQQKSCRVLMNLLEDGTAEFYVGTLDGGVHSTEKYEGTYSLGENEEYDETISFSYTYGEGQTAEVKDAVILDDIFEASFYLLGSLTENEVKFYETSPASMDGDVYVGYMTKTGGMGAMVYAYSLCLKEDNTFDVSIMQLASVMHVWGATGGTYAVDGESITFTYDILTTDGELVEEAQVAEGSGYSEEKLSTAFNIQQATMKASMAPFIRVK